MVHPLHNLRPCFSLEYVEIQLLVCLGFHNERKCKKEGLSSNGKREADWWYQERTRLRPVKKLERGPCFTILVFCKQHYQAWLKQGIVHLSLQIPKQLR